MSKSKHTIDTPYGEATIETYDCDSCGNTVAYENTVPFTIGNTEGRACEHCEEKGPISFPKRVVEWSYPKDVTKNGEYGLFFHVALGLLVLPIVMIGGFTESADQFDEGFATGAVTFFVWVVLPLLLFILLV